MKHNSLLNKVKTVIVRKHLSKIFVNPMPTIEGEELKYLLKKYVAKSAWFTGNDVEVLETNFKEYLKVKYAVSFSKARVGLYTILRALGIGKGDEVILPAFTCCVVPTAIIYAGATPVYVDIDKETFNLGVNQLEKLITKKTKAIVAHHIFGQSCAMNEIIALGKKYNLVIIEDAAQALGGEYHNKKLGTLGDVGFFSLDYSKNITCGQGGIVVTNNKALYEKIKNIQTEYPCPSQHEIKSTIKNLLRLSLGMNRYTNILGEAIIFLQNKFDYLFFKKYLPTITVEELNGKQPSQYTYAAKLPPVLAGLGVLQLKKLDYFNKKRMQNAKIYDDALKRLGIFLTEKIPSTKHVYLRYATLLTNEKNREKILDLFRQEQIEIGLWFNAPLYPAAADAKKLGYTQGSCPNAENISKRIINLPNHPNISRKDINRVLKILKKGKELGLFDYSSRDLNK